MKKYEEIDFRYGCNIRDAVNDLLRYKEKGKLVFGTFNGTKLYSDTVTTDSAHQEILGKTEAEFDKSQEEWRENYRREEREFKESVPALSEEWKKRGRDILSEDKFEYWDEIVPIRLGDLYHGMELGNCLDIIKVLNNNGTLDEAKEVIEKQDHSGMSFSLVRLMVKELCDRGQEFYNYIK